MNEALNILPGSRELLYLIAPFVLHDKVVGTHARVAERKINTACYSSVRERRDGSCVVVYYISAFIRESAGRLITGNKLKDIQAWSRDAKGETNGPAQRLSQHSECARLFCRGSRFMNSTCTTSHRSLSHSLPRSVFRV